MDNILNITQADQKNISNYKNGILDGSYTSYYDNEKLMEESHYKNGLMEGKRILRWANGNVKEKIFLKKELLLE